MSITTKQVDDACWAFVRHMAHHYGDAVPDGPEEDPAGWDAYRGGMRVALEAALPPPPSEPQPKETPCVKS